MSEDLLAILTGKPSAAPKLAAAPAAAPKPAKTYDPREAAIRTALAEESDPTAQEWVLGTIANRLKSGKHGKDFYEVVTAKDQFEPWARGTAQAVDVNSEAYKNLAARAADILDGKRDPSGGAMNFYAPKAQAELSKVDGRPEKAEFDDGTGVMVGNTLFFRSDGKAVDGAELAGILGAQPDMKAAEADFAKEFGDPKKWDAAAKGDGAGLVSYTSGIKDSLDDPQTKLLTTFEKGGFIDRKEPAGSERNPLWMTSETSEKDVPPGAYYVTRGKDAALMRADGGEKGKSSFIRGLSRGAGDVMTSVAEALPGTDDSTIKNRLVADQMAYDADLKGDLKSGIGRFTGQVLASAPVLAGAEAAAAPVLAASTLGKFVAGTAGKAMAPGAARLATRGASLATRGAAEGTAAAGLVSSASDAPIGEQLLTGAITGGVAAPAAAAAGAGLKRVLGVGAPKGAIPVAEQQDRVAAAAALPQPIPLTKGEITGSPAAQLTENAILRGGSGDPAANVVQAFKAEQQEAIRGNVKSIADLVAGKETAQGEGAKAVSDTLNARRDAMKVSVNKAYDNARERGEDAILTTADEVREGIADGLKRKFNQSKIGAVMSEVDSIGAKTYKAEDNLEPAVADDLADTKVVGEKNEPIVVYHGAMRGDRIHEAGGFKADRATSGPMPYFTDSQEIASNYAKGKQDTSHEVDDWETTFSVGGKSLKDAWDAMPVETKNLIRQKGHLAYVDADGKVGFAKDEASIPEDASHFGKETWDHYLRDRREGGHNGLRALYKVWVESGSIFGEEAKFGDILKAFGVQGAKYDDPHAEFPAVFPSYLNIKNPLDVNAVPNDVAEALREASKTAPEPKYQSGADQWDKRAMSPALWMEMFEAAQKSDNPASEFGFTVIPDWVTDTLKKKGYDGIKDVGGKMGGDGHAVWVPFSEDQVIPAIGRKMPVPAETGTTVRQLYEARERLVGLTQSHDPVEAAAAKAAKDGFDAYIETALKNDLFKGDPKAITAWRDAIKKRAEFGRLFEGNDLIEGLTAREARSGEVTLKVDPEEAANYILNRADLGFIGKKNLARDLKRLQTVLGKDSEEWNGLRAEVFTKIARAGEGPPEGGQPQFSGQKFMKAWEKAKADAGPVLDTVFTKDERALIDDFAKVAQIATTPVKGGDNASNSAIAAKRLLAPIMQFFATMGGAGGGAAVGGPAGAAVGSALGALLKQLQEVVAVGKARRLTYGAKPVSAKDVLNNPIISVPAAAVRGAPAILGSSLSQSGGEKTP